MSKAAINSMRFMVSSPVSPRPYRLDAQEKLQVRPP
jgi:hypothetical protein